MADKEKDPKAEERAKAKAADAGVGAEDPIVSRTVSAAPPNTRPMPRRASCIARRRKASSVPAWLTGEGKQPVRPPSSLNETYSPQRAHLRLLQAWFFLIGTRL